VNTIESIKDLAARQFGVEATAIDVDVPLDQLGIDSLGFLEFMFEVEDRFGLSVPQESLKEVRTLHQLADLVDGLLAARSSATT